MITEAQTKQKLFLLDAYALIYRSYFAFIRNPRINSKGLNTSAILGFVITLEQLLNDENPSHIGVVFDVHGATFRHDMYPEYKANREAMPEDIRNAIPFIRNIIQAYNIPIIEKQGYEADDVIGTLARKAEKRGFATYMITPDKDYAQLVTEKTRMYKPAKSGGNPEIWGIPEVRENFGVSDPLQVIDILGLMGDTADNIPGCPGIGPKTAMKLIGDYGSIEGLYEHLSELKGKLQENLFDFKEQVFLSRKLAVIDQHVPVDVSFEELAYQEANVGELSKLFNELEFRTLLQKIQTRETPPPPPKDFEQGDLFATVQAQTQSANKHYSDVTTQSHIYHKIENETQRATLRDELFRTKAFCFDTETTGLDPLLSDLVCLSFSFKPHEAWCVLLPPDRKEAQKIVDEFKSVFENPSLGKIGQNIKYDLLMLAQYGVKVKGALFDTMIAHYLLQPDARHNLDSLTEIYLGYKKVTTQTLIGEKGKNQRTMRSVDTDQLVEYACEDADLTYQLMQILKEELARNNLTGLFERVEMPLVPVLVTMEMNGVSIDPDALKSYAFELRESILRLEKEIIDLAGEDFLITSPKQLGVILFEKLKIDPNAKKTKTKQYSTSEEVLTKLAHKHPIINKILEYRGLRKLLNTYVETLPELINPRTGKIHTSYNQAVAATGRLSSVNPNLQNIPIRDATGREIRKAFIPSEKGMLYLSADYSQIELRIMASMSGDDNMIEAFRNNLDVHAITASKIYRVPVSEVHPEMRRKAKTANFGIIYGISAFGLSQRLNISRSEAKEIIDGYFDAFPKVKSYMEQCIANAREKGYVTTLLGRKRHLPDINSSNSVVRGVAERNAINAPIQGTAADIIKIAMIEIHRKMDEGNIRSRMIIQVHDELNFEVYPEEMERLSQIVSEEMSRALKLNVPLTVDMGKGLNWLEAH